MNIYKRGIRYNSHWKTVQVVRRIRFKTLANSASLNTPCTQVCFARCAAGPANVRKIRVNARTIITYIGHT